MVLFDLFNFILFGFKINFLFIEKLSEKNKKKKKMNEKSNENNSLELFIKKLQSDSSTIEFDITNENYHPLTNNSIPQFKKYFLTSAKNITSLSLKNNKFFGESFQGQIFNSNSIKKIFFLLLFFISSTPPPSKKKKIIKI